jgi:hypothetical protein
VLCALGGLVFPDTHAPGRLARRANTYNDGFLERLFVMVPLPGFAAKFLQCMQDYPPSQIPGSFKLSKIEEQLKRVQPFFPHDFQEPILMKHVTVVLMALALSPHQYVPPIPCRPGMTTEEFENIVCDWLATAKHPKTGRRYTEMVYQPMLERTRHLTWEATPVKRP